MKDYSKVKYVKPSVDGKYFSKYKIYEFEHDDLVAGYLIGDDSQRYFVFLPNSVHLNNMPFIPCDKDGNEIEI